MNDVEKFTSNLAAVECRYNPVQERWRVHVAVGRKRIDPLLVRVPGDTDDAEAADVAARIALSRAIARNLVRLADVDHEDGVPIVHADGAKRKAPLEKMKSKAPASKGAAPVERKAPATTEQPVTQKATKSKRPAPPMGEEKANEIIGDGEETQALNALYESVKDEYHEVGEALKERHLAVAAMAAQPQ